MSFKGNCPIVRFRGENFLKSPKIYIDKAVVSKFEEFDALAEECQVIIHQERSFDIHVKYENDEPHFIGRGLKFQVQFKKGVVRNTKSKFQFFIDLN